MACKMVFCLHRQPDVSEAKKSHSFALLICLEVCRLAQNDITHYQTQPLTCVVCLGLIFLSHTLLKFGVVLLAMVVAIYLTNRRLQHRHEGQSVCFLYCHLAGCPSLHLFAILSYMSPPDKKFSSLQVKIYLI